MLLGISLNIFLNLSQDPNEIFHKYFGQELAVPLRSAFSL